MTKEILIAGFGGQGVLSMGKILAYAGVLRGKEVTWLPSYGPEQRGGTSNVTVVISDERISSPIVNSYDIVVALNQQSVSKFESKVKSGGTFIYDSYGVKDTPSRTDIKTHAVDATLTANEQNLQKMYNTLVLGALLSIEPMVDNDAILGSIRKTLPERYQHLVADNERALNLGHELVA